MRGAHDRQICREGHARQCSNRIQLESRCADVRGADRSSAWDDVGVKTRVTVCFMPEIADNPQIKLSNLHDGPRISLSQGRMGQTMLLQFDCANHKSVKDRISFSMLAGSDNSGEEYLKVFGKNKVLRSAAIYGANGSGKSNFLDAVRYVCNMVGRSVYFPPGTGSLQLPHKLSSPGTPSEYEIKFVKNDILYAYGFAVVGDRVDEEYMYYWPKGRKVRIFERRGVEINAGPKFRGQFDTSIKEVLKPNRLFLSCAANYSAVAPVEEGFQFFTKDLVVYDSDLSGAWLNYSMRTLSQEQHIKDVFLQVLKALGIPVQDVRIEFEPVSMADLRQVAQIPPLLEELIGGQNRERVEVKVVYDQFETDLMNEESDGIKRLFQILCPLIDIMENGKVVLWDELEANLHEALVLQILHLFRDAYRDRFAQLIFTTHDSSLLNSGLFRRDQIWFTEQNQNRSTDLYSLSEIRCVRKGENLAKGYLNGKYGAIPVLDQSVLKQLAQEQAE